MSRGRLLFVALSLTTIALLAAGSLWAANERQNEAGDDSLYKFLAVFSETFSLVNRAYVDELQEDQLLAGAFEGTLDALDPFSFYVPPSASATYERVKKVGSRHSGMVVLKERGVVYIVAVAKGSPADLAGIEPGRILSQLEGNRTRPMPLLTIHEILAGDVGTEVELETIDQSRGGAKETLHLKLAEFPSPTVELRQERGVPVLRLPIFHGSTPADVKASLEAISAQTPQIVELTETDKLVVDLRGVAGGDERAAYDVAAFFASGQLGVLAGRTGEIETFTGTDPPLFTGQIAVLIDTGTQGAAEVLAHVLHQSREATLVGERSFGHSGLPGLISLSNGASLQITQAFFSGPDGEPIKESLVPDLRVYRDFVVEKSDEEDEDENEDQPILDKALDRALDSLLDEGEEEDVAEAA
jgi:carboxyl-terminal processing protease